MINHPYRCFIEITTECNLQCKLCKLWIQKDPKDHLDLKQKLDFTNILIKWMKRLNPNFKSELSVIMTGGEPFLKPDNVFKLAQKCYENNISSYVNTNGSLVKPIIPEILNSGLSAITFSLDSHISELHDDLRNCKGLFNKVIETIRTIIIKKEKEITSINICVQSVLGKWNINSVHDQVQFFKDLGIDGLLFQPIHYPFGLSIPAKWYETFDFFPDSEVRIEEALKDLSKLKNQDDFIMNSKEEIELWRQYFRNPEYLDLDKNPCRAYEQNLIMNVQGNVKFCFNMPLTPQNRIGNILTDPLVDLWNGAEALKVKEQMKGCDRACGIMACHINTNLRNAG